jgi:hypothetical protein
MPPTRSKKTEYRVKLYARIVLSGNEMSPCSRCEQKDLKCLVAADARRCSECVRSGVKCDVLGPSQADWVALERGEKKLREQLEAAEAEHRKFVEGLLETQNRVERLKKQRESFVARAAAMLRRGLKTLDELDAVEEAEAHEAASRALTPAASADASGDLSGDPLDFSGVAFDADLPMSPSFWDSIGVAGETSSKAPGS